jgi:hypothetical protein
VTDSGGTTPFNSAAENANVDVQADTIYGGVSIVHIHEAPYDPPDGATAEEKFRTGVRNLAGHQASKARTLIWEAMMGGYETSETRFYWLIAMLSERTIRQFSDEEISQLRNAAKQQPAVTTNSWEDGAHLIFELLESVGVLPANPRPHISQVVKELDTLSKKQRDLLLPHLELFLEGPLKDRIWREERSNAESEQSRGDRRNRAWMFFQPIPAEPRVTQAQDIVTTSTERLLAVASYGIFIVTVGFFGWELLWHGAVLGLLPYVIAITGTYFAAVTSRELHFLAERRRQNDARLRTPAPSTSAPPRGGFAAKVDALFDRYAAKYVPDKDERADWEAATAGIRKFDRDEIVTQYREARIPPERVAWLIRYRIRQSRDHWRSGKLYEYREQLRPKPSTVSAFRTATAVIVLGVVGAIVMLRADPLADAVGVIALLPSGMWARRNWLRIDLERRRFAADTEESAHRKADACKEFTRWSDKLKCSPSDTEMAAWLDCDRTVLLAKAMDHYKLARHQVITHAFLEAPGTRAKRARVRNGPMRYSRYSLIVFLLTSDGVRQMSADLLFLQGDVREGDRLNFRYDAVASAHVSQTPRASARSRIQQTFKLTLVNGEPISVIVTDLDPEDFKEGETEQSLERATLDAASVANTLHVLEGIAAEGKAWLQQRREGHSRNAG